MTLDRATLREILDRYIAGERPASIAAALGLDVAEVEALCLPPTSVGAIAKAVTARPKKRKRKAPEEPAAPPARADDYTDPAKLSAHRNGPASHCNNGYGYASVRGGGRKWL